MGIMQATNERRVRSMQPRMSTRAATILFFGLLVAAGCTASSEEVRPPAAELYFPTGAALAPDESHLFVANANSELRFDSGSISVLPLASIDSVIERWLSAREIPAGTSADGRPKCEQDPNHSETLQCDEADFLASESGVRIGNFATDIAVQDLDNNRLRLVVPTRGDPSIAWVNWTGDHLECSQSPEGFALCDDDHRLSFVGDNPDAAIPEEPFGVFADTAGRFAMVTHLTTGAITLIDSPKDENAVVSDIVLNVFLPDPNTGLRGATGVVGRLPRAADDIIYVGSRSEDRIQTFTVGRPVNGARPFLLQGNYFFLNGVGGTNGGSVDTRGMAFSPSGDRLYLVNRRPPALHIIDTSASPTGFPKNDLIGAADICRQGSTVAVADSGDGERAYVTCFQDGQLYVINPRDTKQADDIVLVGRGPYSVVAAPGRRRLYVTNFLEDTIAVLDLTPGSPTRNRVVLRIGRPRGQ